MKSPHFNPSNTSFGANTRQQSDTAADSVFQKLLEHPESSSILRQINQLQTNTDLKQLQSLDFFQDFLHQHLSLPPWADAERMQNAQKLFAQHTQMIMSMLGFLSLPYCYAGANGAQVLYLSQRIRQDIENRLRETGQFVWEVMQPDAFDLSGKGLANILKVRLLHAHIRFQILKSGQWNPAWGAPINQMDMAGTNLAFSWICLRGLRKIGISINAQAAEDFLHLWNVIGYLSGVEPEWLPETGKSAFWLDKRIAQSEFQTSQAGKELTQSLLGFLTQATQAQFSAGFASAYTRFLLGNEVADILGIPTADYWNFSWIRLIQSRNLLQIIFPDWQKQQNTEIKQVFEKQAAQIVLPHSQS
ncbi:MAG: DUF2236 domain-containing protein [Microscillaceae bacterium]|jgi:hypothetical protein|nr:DUF2236 domain-containing protein [Microscillaceae bacterium]